MHGRWHVRHWLIEFSGVAMSCFTLSRWTVLLLLFCFVVVFCLFLLFVGCGVFFWVFCIVVVVVFFFCSFLLLFVVVLFFFVVVVVLLLLFFFVFLFCFFVCVFGGGGGGGGEGVLDILVIKSEDSFNSLFKAKYLFNAMGQKTCKKNKKTKKEASSA